MNALTTALPPAVLDSLRPAGCISYRYAARRGLSTKTMAVFDVELALRVPREHPEIERLREVWADKGGLQEGGTVTLMNGNPAVIRSMTDDVVMLDANHPFAGSDILFDLTLRDIRANEE